jgi:hypothetical protein
MMNKREYTARRRDAWRRFEELLDRLDAGARKRLSAAESTEFSRLFRELCYDLSQVRSRDWGEALSNYLNDLVSRGHNAFYSAPPGKLSHVARFLAVDFPRTFRRNAGYFAVAAALFFVPLAIAWGVVQADPSLARRVIPAEALEEMKKMYDAERWNEPAKPAGERGDFSDQRSLMF